MVEVSTDQAKWEAGEEWGATANGEAAGLDSEQREEAHLWLARREVSRVVLLVGMV